jgi:hypothetical protein
MMQDFRTQFQTPPDVCKYMVSLIPDGVQTVLEPTPGIGNLVKALAGYEVTAPSDFFTMEKLRFDCVVMNPPFSSKSAYGVPQGLNKHGMRLGYYILIQCMHMSDNIVALMPWFTLLDSDVRFRSLKKWGLISVTSLPRKTFEYARIQTVVLHLQRGYKGETALRVYDLLNAKHQAELYG